MSKHKISCNQVLYYLGNRGIEKQLLPYCDNQGIAMVGYSPFGHVGFPSPGIRQGKVLAEIAERNNRTPRQVALNFLTRLPNTFSIPKARKTAHVRENSYSVGWHLSAKDVSAIEQAFPLPAGNAPLEMI
jgi:diketogulonate reductase-like aldo/keto reductase